MLIPKVKNDKVDTITSRKGIANVFGELYSKLYAGDETEEELQNTLNQESRAVGEKKRCINGEILLITDEEIQAAINKLKKGKASDNNGIRAEDIKTCDNVTKETIKNRSLTKC